MKHVLTEEKLMLAGGIVSGDFSDPMFAEAIKRSLDEFLERAFQQNQMSNSMTVVMGEITDIQSQIVSGTKYIITMMLGVTDNPVCRRNARGGGLVGYKNCPDKDCLEESHFSVVHQVWGEIPWKWFDYDDLERTQPLKELYWDLQEQ